MRSRAVSLPRSCWRSTAAGAPGVQRLLLQLARAGRGAPRWESGSAPVPPPSVAAMVARLSALAYDDSERGVQKPVGLGPDVGRRVRLLVDVQILGRRAEGKRRAHRDPGPAGCGSGPPDHGAGRASCDRCRASRRWMRRCTRSYARRRRPGQGSRATAHELQPRVERSEVFDCARRPRAVEPGDHPGPRACRPGGTSHAFHTSAGHSSR